MLNCLFLDGISHQADSCSKPAPTASIGGNRADPRKRKPFSRSYHHAKIDWTPRISIVISRALRAQAKPARRKQRVAPPKKGKLTLPPKGPRTRKTQGTPTCDIPDPERRGDPLGRPHLGPQGDTHPRHSYHGHPVGARPCLARTCLARNRPYRDQPVGLSTGSPRAARNRRNSDAPKGTKSETGTHTVLRFLCNSLALPVRVGTRKGGRKIRPESGHSIWLKLRIGDNDDETSMW